MTMSGGKPPERFGGAPSSDPALDDDADLPVVDPNRLARFGAGPSSSELGISDVSYRAAAELDEVAGLGENTGARHGPVTGMAQFDAAPVLGLDGTASLQVHGTAVAVDGRAALFVGHSGAGKSATALSMMAAGAQLVADDQVVIARHDNRLMLQALPGAGGMIEARGIGLLQVDAAETAELVVVVDLDRTELHRLPPARTHEILTQKVHLVLGRENWSLEPALLALLAGRMVSPKDR